jgi:hypothetical protein
MACRALTLIVDEELVWVVAQPAVQRTAVRPASRRDLLELTRLLDTELQAARQQLLLARVLDEFARAVAESADQLPPLPFIGEPFGGQGGTD